ncbi:hypothetical protein KBY27_10445 [Ruegeria pomeroyi]|uniref:HEAT repeat domain-containing protein n=1 Tax=Ruegeria pomeroyi TaxID=89184 RepID=A0A9Q3WL88_9RHOB|nr:hypothetical protein [Ruegeria pomeroyi]MCE8537880.1 hypothetical protein [Ruegeria pomeroyi]
MTISAKVGWLAFVLSWLACDALACGVCIERPEKTFADLILEADTVVLAREDVKRPFRFEVTAVLAGSDPADLAIPFLVDSATRRKLSSNASEGVLMVRQDSTWTRVGYADAALQTVTGEILSFGPDWQVAPAARFAFFEARLHDADPMLRHLAVDELSRAPYDRLRAMKRPVDGMQARHALADRAQLPWRQFYILMLGLSDHIEDHQLVRHRLARELRSGGSTDLQAWATAFLEIDGQDALAKLVHDWLEQPETDTDAVRAVIAALSTHARFADFEMASSIVPEIAALARRRPDVVGSVASALGQIGEFSYGDMVQSAVSDLPLRQARAIDAAELFAASAYVHRARATRPIDPLAIVERK